MRFKFLMTWSESGTSLRPSPSPNNQKIALIEYNENDGSISFEEGIAPNYESHRAPAALVIGDRIMLCWRGGSAIHYGYINSKKDLAHSDNFTYVGSSGVAGASSPSLFISEQNRLYAFCDMASMIYQISFNGDLKYRTAGHVGSHSTTFRVAPFKMQGANWLAYKGFSSDELVAGQLIGNDNGLFTDVKGEGELTSSEVQYLGLESKEPPTALALGSNNVAIFNVKGEVDERRIHIDTYSIKKGTGYELQWIGGGQLSQKPGEKPFIPSSPIASVVVGQKYFIAFTDSNDNPGPVKIALLDTTNLTSPVEKIITVKDHSGNMIFAEYNVQLTPFGVVA